MMARHSATYRGARREKAKEVAKAQRKKLREVWPFFLYNEKFRNPKRNPRHIPE